MFLYVSYVFIDPVGSHAPYHSLQLGTCSEDANGSTLPTANKGLFAYCLLLVSGKGEEAASSSFKTNYALIQASSASLETLIATWYIQWGNKQMPIGQSFTFVSGEGDEATSPSFTTRYAPIPASSASLKTLIATRYVQWDAKRSTLNTAKNVYLPIFYFFASREGDEVASPLLYNKLRDD